MPETTAIFNNKKVTIYTLNKIKNLLHQNTDFLLNRIYICYIYKFTYSLMYFFIHVFRSL